MSKKELSDEAKASIKEFFDLFDQNGDGSITAKELKEILEGNGEVVSEEEVNEFVSSFVFLFFKK